MQSTVHSSINHPRNNAPAPPPERFNFARYLLNKATSHADRIAYIDDNCTLTYGELSNRVRCVAAGLLAAGLQRGDRLLLVLQDDVDFPVAFLGALYAGIMPVPVNTALHAADYSHLIRHSDAKGIVTYATLLPIVTEAIAAITPAQQVAIKLLITGRDIASDVNCFESLIAHAPLAEAADTGSADEAFCLYSSGSTGRPKAVVHAHASLYWTAELYAKNVLGLRADDIVLSAAKLFFAYGLGNELTFPLCVGATVILIAERVTPQAIFQRLVRYQPTVFFGIPTLYAAMLTAAALPPREQVALRLCVSAGEALPRAVGEKYRQHFGCDVLDGLGSTEMLHIYLSNRVDALRYGSSGKPVPGYEIVLRGQDGQTVGSGDVGDIGELYVRGPSAALMVWSESPPSQRTPIGDWIGTGDNYRIDADGFYFNAGRSDDMLKVSGQFVSPTEVENALIEHVAVLECAVVGKTDADGLMKTAAFVVLRQQEHASQALSDELKNFVKGRLAPHKYPRTIIFIDALPKTATGKIQRFKLRER